MDSPRSTCGRGLHQERLSRGSRCLNNGLRTSKNSGMFLNTSEVDAIALYELATADLSATDGLLRPLAPVTMMMLRSQAGITSQKSRQEGSESRLCGLQSAWAMRSLRMSQGQPCITVKLRPGAPRLQGPGLGQLLCCDRTCCGLARSRYPLRSSI